MVSFVSITGGTGAGKTTLANQLKQALGGDCSVISMDCFYRELEDMPSVCQLQPGCDPKLLNADEKADAYNMDRPESFDFEGLLAALDKLKQGVNVRLAEYDFPNYTLSKTEFVDVKADGVVILEGIQALANTTVNSMMDLKVFLDTPDDIRFMRRIERDVSNRGRSLSNLISHTIENVKPMHDLFVAPCRGRADLVLPTWPSDVGRDAVIQYCLKLLRAKRMPTNLSVACVCESSSALLTRVRDQTTDRKTFVRYMDRLSRLVVEHCIGLGSLRSPETVTSPVNGTYTGCSLLTDVCCVSIVRSGEAMELAVRNPPLAGLASGRLLFQFASDQTEWKSTDSKKPRLVYNKMPPKISEYSLVLVCDPVIGHGKAVFATVDTITELGVPAENITVASVICSRQFLNEMQKREPKVTVVAVEVDEEVVDGYCYPGLGNFADRYFGTGL
ncbi:MAG: uncharacterized protein KVP18_001076 [Porospora cf. gigantea A]|uniref:uncharacterized protein n=1 Tax=Porospora cf. gigantea A TaxID=2853593 RepID=UPI00355A6FD4|nr:MAG: hypothetical protein KVP18_001076 [Porospora cf. gigantea A]